MTLKQNYPDAKQATNRESIFATSLLHVRWESFENEQCRLPSLRHHWIRIQFPSKESESLLGKGPKEVSEFFGLTLEHPERI